MNEKPPILIEFIKKRIAVPSALLGKLSPRWGTVSIEAELTAQRDADVAYYEPIIEELQGGGENDAEQGVIEVLTELEIRKQARQEVAREMIEIAKREVKFSLRRQLLKMPSVYEQRGVSEDLGGRLEQSLKSK